MKLNTDSSCGFKIRTIGECGNLQVKTAVKKKVLQNKPVACYSSHYKPWCPFPVRTLGKGSLFKLRAKEGWGEKKPKQTHFSQWPLPKKSLNIHLPAGPLPRILFIRSSLLELGAGHGKQELWLGKGDALAEPTTAVRACVCIILYYIIITHSGKTFPTWSCRFPHH